MIACQFYLLISVKFLALCRHTKLTKHGKIIIVKSNKPTTIMEVPIMKAYIAIGHFKDSENIVSIAMTANTKKDFMTDCYGNAFVPYAVLTESMVRKLHEVNDGSWGIYEQVKKLTTNYRVWNAVTEYIEQCFDILEDKLIAAKARG